MQNGPDDLEGQRVELVLLEEVVEVLLQHLKHQAGVAAVLETLQGPHHVVLVRVLAAQAGQDAHLEGQRAEDEPVKAIIAIWHQPAERNGPTVWETVLAVVNISSLIKT